MKTRSRLPWLMVLLALVVMVQCTAAVTDGDAVDAVETIRPAVNHTRRPANRTRRPSNMTATNTPRPPSLNSSGFSMPQFELSIDIQLGKSAIAAGAIGLGFVLCLTGIVSFKPILGLCGFVVGGVITAKAVMIFAADKPWVTQGSWLGFAVGGLVVAGIIACLGRIIIGMAGGVLIAFTVYVLGSSMIYPEDPIMVFYGLGLVLGLLFGLLALPFKKPVIILSTSYIGAVMAVWGVGHFAGHFPNIDQLMHYESPDFNGNTVVVIPSEWLSYFAAIIVLLLLGVVIQYNVTLQFIKRRRWKKYMKSSRKLFAKKFKKHHRHSYDMDQHQFYAMYGPPMGHHYPMRRDPGFFV